MTLHQQTLSQRLDSWKEVSQYLRRGVRTVQRWERSAGLPVHRIGSGPRPPVIAFADELDAWLAANCSWQTGEISAQKENALVHPSVPLNQNKILILTLTLQQLETTLATSRRIRQMSGSDLFSIMHERQNL